MIIKNKEWPKVNEIRACINNKERIKKTFLGLFHFFLPLLVWVGSLAGIILAPWWAKSIIGLVNGHAIGIMLIIGHDALHGSLFPQRWMNRLAGRISMAPAFHPVTSWVHTHNGLHHGFTMIKGKDAGFPPLALQEYRAMSLLGKLSYRISRSWYGCGWLYVSEMWFKWEFFPIAARAPKNHKAFLRDRLQLAAFFIAWISLLIGSAFARGENLFLMVAWGFILPQCVSNYFTGFVTLQQHTHPRVAWYSELDAPSPAFVQAQLHGAPHIVFPSILRGVMRSTMEHTVHHADTAVPLYCLQKAQETLEQSFGGDIIQEHWTASAFLRSTRICRLYDYGSHQWIDYDGKPLTEALYERCLQKTKAGSSDESVRSVMSGE